jgi:hypothetical protein
MSKLHSSLSLKNNILMVLLWGVLFVVLFVLSNLKPIEITVAGILFGIAGGMMQWQGFNEAPDNFLKANTLFEVRSAFKSTKWGRRYLLFLKFAGILLVIIAFARPRNILTDVLTGYFAMMFARELVTLGPTMKLETLALTANKKAS